MSKTITNQGLTFICDTPLEVWRAETAFTKEPGTVEWLRNTLKPGDVFYDIGANIGVYTLMAAQLGATVYAFEPHVGNAWHLMRNVQANGLQSLVRVVLTPLDGSGGLEQFHYRSLDAGSSGSQLEEAVGEDGRVFVPALTVWTAVMSLVDATDSMPAPDVLKMDVDGRELDILEGASLWALPTRSLQIEVHPGDRAAIHELLIRSGYRFDGQHFTANGQKQIEQGADPATITDNAVFTRAA